MDDWIELPVGAERDFNGYQGRWFGNVNLPKGWKYRTKDRDLEIHAINGVARIVQDDLEGTYNACFEESGQASCTYKP